MKNNSSVIQRILERKVRFVLVFFLLFTTTYAALFFLDFLPEPPSDEQEIAVQESLQTVTEEPLNIEIVNEEIVAEEDSLFQIAVTDSASAIDVLPTSIYIEKLDKTVDILNPISSAIEELDKALLGGAVRHPDSAALNEEGNVFLLGHSSYLPNVRNDSFQAFNGIQNLEWGDTIELSDGDKTYTYRVDKVYKAKASELVVPMTQTGHQLTIATCNSFGSTDDRYIVEATRTSVTSN